MPVSADAIVDAALELAEQSSWESVRLYAVADHLGADLAAIQAHFREKEELADAWFDRADAAMVAAAAQPEIQALPSSERLHYLIMAWLETLSPHRRVTREMVKGKLEPGHLHVQIPAVLRISRTVQWLREAARRDAGGVHRGLEETVLTSIFVTTFTGWLADGSDGARVTRARLSRLLHGAAWMARWVPGYHHAPQVPALPGAQVEDNERTGAAETRA
ncbi:TetR/AcrR family transcriptional regulator [Aquisalimonas asiatica]|uniref:Transcriptional regulator, TetR family n=1 Tax=Aquisalimonas asiatica TaxID=406100 RepID=A0A1H8V829_9GAMM|nr:TetR/AcrR family transcriptional regulator [Aquisalimonas asiatica]SEP11404.1 transcriptional regulator, TetR family [Aquisalimonas asiatica]